MRSVKVLITLCYADSEDCHKTMRTAKALIRLCDSEGPDQTMLCGREGCHQTMRTVTVLITIDQTMRSVKAFI